MKNKIFYTFLIILLMPEKVLQLLGVFLFGDSLGYYMFEYLRHKNKKEENEDFFSNYNKQYGSNCRSTCKQN